jgi:hypothetical protein
MSECPSCHRYAPPDSETGYDADELCRACERAADETVNHTDDKRTRKLAVAAVAWNRARVFAERLKAAREFCLCELADEGHQDEDFAFHRPGATQSQWHEKPCWKDWTMGPNGEDPERAPESEWCDSCRLRQRIHEAYKLAVRTRGARMRVLQRYARELSKTEAA